MKGQVFFMAHHALPAEIAPCRIVYWQLWSRRSWGNLASLKHQVHQHAMITQLRPTSNIRIIKLYKNFSYRRNSACRPSLHCSSLQGHARSSMLVLIESMLLLVNNTNSHPVLHCFPVIAQHWSNYRLWQWVPFVNALVLGNLYKLKTKFFELHFRRRQYGLYLPNFDAKLPNSIE